MHKKHKLVSHFYVSKMRKGAKLLTSHVRFQNMREDVLHVSIMRQFFDLMRYPLDMMRQPFGIIMRRLLDGRRHPVSV